MARRETAEPLDGEQTARLLDIVEGQGEALTALTRQVAELQEIVIALLDRVVPKGE